MLQAVLFDMDGLLVDSEQYWEAAMGRIAAELGGTWTHEDVTAVVGTPLIESAAYLLRTVAAEHRGDDPRGVVDRMVADVLGRLRQHLPWRPGARELLETLRTSGVPAALVSSSYRVLVDVVVAGLPAGTFATSVAGDEVARPKPAPDPYLTACARLGVEPGRTVVLEDSPTGATAGVAAGCHVVAVPFLAAVPLRVTPLQRSSLEGLDVADLEAVAAGEPYAPGVPAA